MELLFEARFMKGIFFFFLIWDGFWLYTMSFKWEFCEVGMVKWIPVCLVSMKKDFFSFLKNFFDHLYTTNFLLIFLFFWEEENIIK